MTDNPYPTYSGFGLRVHHAEKAIRKLALDPFADIYTRGFDNCFEMNDGSAVIWALMDKAIKEPDCYGQNHMSEGIQRIFSRTLEGRKYPECWLKVYYNQDQLELF